MTAHADPSSAGPPRSPIVGVVMLCVVVGVGALLAFFALASPTPAAPDATATTTAVGSTTATDSTDVLIGGAAPGTALAALGTLDVKGRAPKTGYDRGQFGQQWADVDRNGCDTRNDILVRDLTAAQIKPGTRGCLVLSGTLADPYTATSLAFVRGASTSEALQVDPRGRALGRVAEGCAGMGRADSDGIRERSVEPPGGGRPHQPGQGRR